MQVAEFIGERGWFEEPGLREWARTDLSKHPPPKPRAKADVPRTQRLERHAKNCCRFVKKHPEPSPVAEVAGTPHIVARLEESSPQQTPINEEEPSIIDLAKETAILAPIRLCPPEILAVIFVYTLYPEDSHSKKTKPRELKDPAILSVCHQWRDIALSTPQYWSVISLELPGPVYNRQPSAVRTLYKARLDRNISRSGNIPLVLQSGNYVSTEHGKDVGALISALSPRCIAFHAVDFCTPFCYAAQDPRCDFSNLTTLELAIWRNGTPHIHDSTIEIPNLRYLSASKWGLGILPQLRCPNVEFLRLSQMPCRAPQMQALSDRFPLVHTLRLQEVENPRTTSPPITFENLTTLILEGASWSWCFPILSSSKRVAAIELHGIFFEQAAAISAPKEPFPELKTLTFFFSGSIALTRTWKLKMKSWFTSLLSKSANLQHAMIGIKDAEAGDSAVEQLSSFFTALSEPGDKGQIVCPLLASLTLKKAKFTLEALELFKASRTRPGHIIGECEVTLDECEVDTGERGETVEEAINGGHARQGQGLKSVIGSLPDLTKLRRSAGTPNSMDRNSVGSGRAEEGSQSMENTVVSLPDLTSLRFSTGSPSPPPTTTLPPSASPPSHPPPLVIAPASASESSLSPGTMPSITEGLSVGDAPKSAKGMWSRPGSSSGKSARVSKTSRPGSSSGKETKNSDTMLASPTSTLGQEAKNIKDASPVKDALVSLVRRLSGAAKSRDSRPTSRG
jgi:hypothetical protein